MKRIIVLKDIYDEYIEALTKEIEKLKVGDPTDPDVDIGPLGSRKILLINTTMIDDAKKFGCKVLAGGDVIDTGSDFGLFVHPSLIEIKPELCEDLSKAPFMWREEAFGPVRSITKAENFDDAIRLANSSNYGMRGVLFSTDEGHVERFKNEIQAGSVFVNTKPGIVDISFPLGGIKDSAYPSGIKYYPQALVYSKFIYDQSPKTMEMIK